MHYPDVLNTRQAPVYPEPRAYSTQTLVLARLLHEQRLLLAHIVHGDAQTLSKFKHMEYFLSSIHSFALGMEIPLDPDTILSMEQEVLNEQGEADGCYPSHRWVRDRVGQHVSAETIPRWLGYMSNSGYQAVLGLHLRTVVTHTEAIFTATDVKQTYLVEEEIIALAKLRVKKAVAAIRNNNSLTLTQQHQDAFKATTEIWLETYISSKTKGEHQEIIARVENHTMAWPRYDYLTKLEPGTEPEALATESAHKFVVRREHTKWLDSTLTRRDLKSRAEHKILAAIHEQGITNMVEMPYANLMDELDELGKHSWSTEAKTAGPRGYRYIAPGANVVVPLTRLPAFHPDRMKQEDYHMVQRVSSTGQTHEWSESWRGTTGEENEFSGVLGYVGTVVQLPIATSNLEEGLVNTEPRADTWTGNQGQYYVVRLVKPIYQDHKPSTNWAQDQYRVQYLMCAREHFIAVNPNMGVVTQADLDDFRNWHPSPCPSWDRTRHDWGDHDPVYRNRNQAELQLQAEVKLQISRYDIQSALAASWSSRPTGKITGYRLLDGAFEITLDQYFDCGAHWGALWPEDPVRVWKQPRSFIIVQDYNTDSDHGDDSDKYVVSDDEHVAWDEPSWFRYSESNPGLPREGEEPGEASQAYS